jgi:tryptophanyl-tRNA synthetase
MPRILSGIQPSGLLHLGNFFGAIREHVRLQDEGEAFYFIADLHALTTVHDAAKLREWVRELAVTYLALGLDPERSVLFRQSDVPEVTEISWLLSTSSGMGLLERAHSYKDKIARGIKPSVGLFTYPILMAADILAYDADLVPVGQDQVQHVEMTQDMAGYFNGRYQSEVFRRPEWRLSTTPRVVGIDGQKMSKSYGNHLWIFEEGKRLKKSVGRITTDSRPPEEPKEPAGVLLFDWLELLLPPGEYEELCRRARAGGPEGPGYGELKACIVSAIDAHFGEAREKRRRLLDDPARVDAILAEGAQRARAAAIRVRDRAYLACGLR